ncbi:MAG: hypothetical protein KC492_45335, partial [Myxococcales bacterium]|nr:hypothetical protein [Myxococcales bacterium]
MRVSWLVAIATLGALGTPEQEVFDTRDEVTLLTRRCEARAGALYLSAPSHPQHVARALDRARRAYTSRAGMVSQRPGWCAQLYERLREAFSQTCPPQRMSSPLAPSTALGPLRAEPTTTMTGREL